MPMRRGTRRASGTQPFWREPATFAGRLVVCGKQRPRTAGDSHATLRRSKTRFDSWRGHPRLHSQRRSQTARQPPAKRRKWVRLQPAFFRTPLAEADCTVASTCSPRDPGRALTSSAVGRSSNPGTRETRRSVPASLRRRRSGRGGRPPCQATGLPERSGRRHKSGASPSWRCDVMTFRPRLLASRICCRSLFAQLGVRQFGSSPSMISSVNKPISADADRLFLMAEGYRKGGRFDDCRPSRVAASRLD
jgi:hypothetical protein